MFVLQLIEPFDWRVHVPVHFSCVYPQPEPALQPQPRFDVVVTVQLRPGVVPGVHEQAASAVFSDSRLRPAAAPPTSGNLRNKPRRDIPLAVLITARSSTPASVAFAWEERLNHCMRFPSYG